MKGTDKVRPWDGTVRNFVAPRPGNCADNNDVPFEPGRRGNAEQRAFQADLKNCVTCPILVACAAHALNHEGYGVWGLTEHQRGSLGGVVPPEWSNRIMDPAKAIAELDAAGIGLETVREILTRANIKHPAVLKALRAAEAAEAAELAAYKATGGTRSKARLAS